MSRRRELLRALGGAVILSAGSLGTYAQERVRRIGAVLGGAPGIPRRARTMGQKSGVSRARHSRQQHCVVRAR